MFKSTQIVAQGSGFSDAGTGIAVVIGLAIVVFIILAGALYASRRIKVGPNQALIISGRTRRLASGEEVGFRVVKGGGSFVWPVLEKYDLLSLELMTIDVHIDSVYTVTGVPIRVDGVAQVKVKGDATSIRTASERFLSMNRNQIMQISLQTLEGHLRAIVGTLTVEEIYKDRDAFASQVQEVATGDMANMGLSIDSFTLRDIQDNEGYLEALGRPRIAQVKRDAIIAQAEADRDANIKSAQANQVGAEAKFQASTKVAEAQRDYEMKKADYQASVNEKKAASDLAYDLQKYKTNQAVKAESVQVEIIEKEKQIELQDKEITRKQRELDATVKAPADAEKYRVTAIAEGERSRIQVEAEGEARAKQSLGEGDAAGEKAKGLARAEVTLAIGSSEAQAMEKKADAFKQYNEAAVAQMIIERLPELAAAVSAPLSKTEKIVIVSGGGNGDSSGAGASRVTQDVTNVLSQLPPIVEALAGVDLNELVRKATGNGVDSPGRGT
jgi:flotillin